MAINECSLKSTSQEGPELAAWLRRIEAAHPKNIELGLDRVRAVWQRLRIERVAGLQIVVAGTNGKGSTLGLIEHAALAQGLSVGTYTSPHIHRYNERVRINGRPLPDADHVDAFVKVEQARGDIALTYFEFGTLAAFVLLAEKGLDLAVLEIGLGGRLDAVNIIDADLAVITSIGLDHTDWLGETLDQIAREKSGIMRPAKPVLLGETCPLICRRLAAEIDAPVSQVGEEFGFEGEEYFSRRFGLSSQYDHALLPRLPLNNISLAAEALLWLNDQRNLGMIPRDFWLCWRGFNLPGRLEKIAHQGVCLYLDVGHNAQAAEYLARTLPDLVAEQQPVIAVYSCLQDKDATKVVAAVQAHIDEWFVAPLTGLRAMTREQLLAAFESASAPVNDCEDFESALRKGIERAQSCGAIILVFGSFVVVEQARALLGEL